MAGSSVRNRSIIATVSTPRGRIDVARQEMYGIKRERGWQLFWVARRTGTHDWHQATTAREAIRRATLLAAKKPPAWLNGAAANAEGQITKTSVEDD